MPPIIATVMVATMTAQSTGDRAIDAATRRNVRLFIAYIVFVLVTAVIGAIFIWLTWDSGNKVQEAIRQDADARIREADARIQEAKRDVEKLEGDNLKLGGDLEKEKGKVAVLQKDAADAKAAQERLESANLIFRRQVADLETRTADAKRKQAEAEIQLAAIRNPRQVPANILPTLKAAPAGKALIAYQTGNQETFIFAMQFWYTLIEAGWQVPAPQPLASTENVLAFTPEMLPAHISGMLPARGEIALEMPSIDPQPKYTKALFDALKAAHLQNLIELRNDKIPEGTVLIVIGPKLLGN
jgi:hypothetical protein